MKFTYTMQSTVSCQSAKFARWGYLVPAEQRFPNNHLAESGSVQLNDFGLSRIQIILKDRTFYKRSLKELAWQEHTQIFWLFVANLLPVR